MNRPQRMTLAVAAVAVTAIQLYIFAEDGVSGVSWILSISIVAALVFLLFASNGTGITSVPSTTREGVDKGLQQFMRTNVEAVSGLADEICADLFGHFKAIEQNITTLPPLSDAARSTVLLYAFALVMIVKLRHNPSFLATDECVGTRQLVVLQCVAADARVIEKGSMSPPTQKLLASHVAEAATIERAVRDFAEQLIQGNTKTTAQMLNDWFAKRTGLSDLGGKSQEHYTRDKLKSAYRRIYDMPA